METVPLCVEAMCYLRCTAASAHVLGDAPGLEPAPRLAHLDGIPGDGGQGVLVEKRRHKQLLVRAEAQHLFTFGGAEVLE